MNLVCQSGQPTSDSTFYGRFFESVRMMTRDYEDYGATRGVTVSMSAFLTCHQCYCAGSSLAWGLNLGAVVYGIF